MTTDRTTDGRMARLEAQIDKLEARQAELHHQLALAQRDQWQARIDALEVQLHLGAMEANDQVTALMEQLRSRWAEARGQFDDAVSTASGVGDTLRGGLEQAAHDLREALLESRNRFTS